MATINPLLKFDPLVSPNQQSGLSFNATVGYEFGLVSDKIINQIGLFYPTGGYTQNHTIKLWENNNSSSPLVTVTINAGTYSNVVDYFYWVNISQITLTGSNYRIGAYYASSPSALGDLYARKYPLANLLVPEPNTIFNGGYLAFGDAYPTVKATDPVDASYFGPNISFKKGPTGQLWPA